MTSQVVDLLSTDQMYSKGICAILDHQREFVKK